MSRAILLPTGDLREPTANASALHFYLACFYHFICGVLYLNVVSDKKPRSSQVLDKHCRQATSVRPPFALTFQGKETQNKGQQLPAPLSVRSQ